MTKATPPAPRTRLHRGMWRGLTAAEIEGILKVLAQESRDLASALEVNTVLMNDLDSEEKKTQTSLSRGQEIIENMKKALIVILEQYKHVMRRLADGRAKMEDLKSSQRRLTHERTKIHHRFSAVSEAIRSGDEAANGASPLISGHFSRGSDEGPK